MNIKHGLLALAGIAVLISCGGGKTDSKGTILAKVNGQTITYEDLIYQLPPAYRGQLQGKDLDDALETWINTELLYEKGLEKGIDKDPVTQAVINFRRKDAIARRFVDLEIANKVIISPQEIDSIYAAQRDSFRLDQDRLHASHILVATKEEADAIYSRLKKGDDFARLAADYSSDAQTSKSGGDLGYFSIDQIDPTFGEAARKLKIGEFSAPVKTPYGYHIIKLLDLQPAGTIMDSVEVKSQLTQQLLSSRQNQAVSELIDNLKKNAKIERMAPPASGVPAMPDTI